MENILNGGVPVDQIVCFVGDAHYGALRMSREEIAEKLNQAMEGIRRSAIMDFQPMYSFPDIDFSSLELLVVHSMYNFGRKGNHDTVTFAKVRPSGVPLSTMYDFHFHKDMHVEDVVSKVVDKFYGTGYPDVK